MIVQIYEIQDAIEAREVCAAGVDHIGILVGDGLFPREISVNNARNIRNAVVAPAKTSVLTLSPDVIAIEQIARALNPEILHLGSLLHEIGISEIRELRKKFPRMQIMRSIPVLGQESVEAADQFASVCDFLLLDTYKDKDTQIGATGLTHDWTISRTIVDRVRIPVILAGGLGAENVREAIQAVNPAGVDSKTLTDRQGTHRKDLEHVRRFVQIAKGLTC